MHQRGGKRETRTRSASLCVVIQGRTTRAEGRRFSGIKTGAGSKRATKEPEDMKSEVRTGLESGKVQRRGMN